MIHQQLGEAFLSGKKTELIKIIRGSNSKINEFVKAFNKTQAGKTLICRDIKVIKNIQTSLINYNEILFTSVGFMRGKFL